MKPIKPEKFAVDRKTSLSTVRRGLASGELSGIRIGRQVFVDGDAESTASWRRPVPINAKKSA